MPWELVVVKAAPASPQTRSTPPHVPSGGSVQVATGAVAGQLGLWSGKSPFEAHP